MAQTVAQVASKLERLRHDRAIWMELVEFLSKCVDDDVREASQHIRAEQCVQSRVPQEVIVVHIERINDDEIDPLNDAIAALENMSVEETNPNAKKATKGPKRPGVKGPRPKGRGAIPIRTAKKAGEAG